MTNFQGKVVNLVLASLLVAVAGCGGGGEEATPVHYDRIISGYVVDQDGAPVADATVQDQDGIYLVQTNYMGQFTIGIEVDDGSDGLFLTASKAGYLNNSASIPFKDDTSHYTTTITLVPAEVQTLNATTGGELVFAGGKLILNFGPDCMMDEFGNVIEGDVEVAVSYTEPEDLLPERLPVPSMNAWDPSSPDAPVGLSSYGMFNMEIYQGEERVYPASGTEFSIELTSMGRFIDTECEDRAEGCYGVDPDSPIPFWTMDEGSDTWQFAGWFTVIDYGPSDTAQKNGTADEDDLVDTDETRYSVYVDVPVGTAGSPPPPTVSYNCDDRAILSCIRGKVEAGGLHGSTESTLDPRDSLSYEPVSGAWVGFQGLGMADFCTQCQCIRQVEKEVCDDPDDENGDGDRECYTTYVDESRLVGPVGSGAGNDPCPPSPGDKSCSCIQWDRRFDVPYAGSAYTDANGEYCANVGQRIDHATVLKEWMITESNPDNGAPSTYSVRYEYHEDLSQNRQLQGLQPNNTCEDGASASCGTFNHQIPCEWFWMNDACVVVGGCETFHMNAYDDDEYYQGWYK